MLARPCLVAVLVLLGVSAARAQPSVLDDFKFYTEDHPPVNFQKAGEARGIMVDVLLEMLSRLGSPKGRADIVVIPWTRGYVEAQRRPNTLLFGMDRTAAREKLFKWVGPVLKSHMVLIAKKEKQIRILNPEEFDGYIFGSIRHDVSEQVLMASGVSDSNIYHLNSPQLVAQMLVRGRIDLWPYERIVAMWILNQEGYNADDFEAVWPLAQSDYYYAFNRETDDRVIAAVQAAFEGVRDDGTLARIVEHYVPGGAAEFLGN